MRGENVLIVGGYGAVGRRLAPQLRAGPARVIVAGRHPAAAHGVHARKIDVDDPESIERALEDVGVVVACVRQREPHLLRAAVRRGIAYTSIAPPWLPWPETRPLHAEAQRTGARIVLAAGLEPGISSVLVRACVDRLGARSPTIETALLLSLGDVYGPDSMGFVFEEVQQSYSIVVDGGAQPARAFERAKWVDFPDPVGRRLAYTMPFRDQLYYPATLGARTAIARIALDPSWLGRSLAVLLRLGLRRALVGGRAREGVHRRIEALRKRYSGQDGYALVVDVGDGERTIRATLVGHEQAHATAAGVAAITEALWTREVSAPGVWLAEQVIAPGVFLDRIAMQGLVPTIRAATRARDPDSARSGVVRAS